jgi:hypothetical protein
VLVEDGPTLDEIHAQEKEESDAASPISEESNIESDDNIEPEESLEEEVNESAEVDYSSMTVVQLKELLKAAGKPVSGKKSDLITRLNE